MAKRLAGGMAALPFPMMGLNIAAGWANQPPMTSPDLQNVVPFDPGQQRGRGGQRCGLSRAAVLSAGNPVQLLIETDLVASSSVGLSGFTPTGANLETSFNWGTNLNGAAFNPQEAGTPWSLWGDNNLLANAVFHDGTAAAESNTSSNGQLYSGVWGQFSPANEVGATSEKAVFLACGTNNATAKRSISMKRQGNAAPAGTWGPTYQLQLVVQVTQAWGTGGSTVANSRVYLLTVADGSGGVTTGKLAAGIALRDNQYLEFVTITDGNAPVVATSIDLVAQFNTLFPGVTGGPLTALQRAWTSGTLDTSAFNVQLCKQASASGNSYIAAVTIVLGGQAYTWTVGQSASPRIPYVLTTTAQGGVNDSIVVALDTPGVLMDGYFQLATVTQATVSNNVGVTYARDPRMLGVCNGSIYLGKLTAMALATSGGTGIYNTGQILSAGFGQGNAYIVDGTTTKQVAIATGVVTDFAAATGKGTLPAGCRICTVWRDRLILANQQGSEQAIYASRQGDYTDWVYGAPDAQQAWALNVTGTAGHIGQPVYCFAPCNDDVALIGCSTSTFAMYGDPGAGGEVVLLSDEVGVSGQDAWCVDPKGIVYFVGTGGLYRWHPAMRGAWGERAMENLSDAKCPSLFQAIDRTKTNVFLCWDHDRHGLYIFLQPMNGTQGTHFFWDERTEGFFKIQYPAAVGPAFPCTFAGDQPADRCILLGGTDGAIRRIDPTAYTDDGTAIASYVNILVPIADDFTQNIVTGMEFWLANDLNGAGNPNPPINVVWTLSAGASAEGAFDAAEQSITGTFTSGGRQQKLRNRIRGQTLRLNLQNTVSGATWAFEKCMVQLSPGGQNR